MVCMTFRLKLFGLVSSFLRKKYINKSKQKKAPGYPEPFKSINFCVLITFERIQRDGSLHVLLQLNCQQLGWFHQHP